MPPLPADFTHARSCKPFFRKILDTADGRGGRGAPVQQEGGRPPGRPPSPLARLSDLLQRRNHRAATGKACWADAKACAARQLARLMNFQRRCMRRAAIGKAGR